MTRREPSGPEVISCCLDFVASLFGVRPAIPKIWWRWRIELGGIVYRLTCPEQVHDMGHPFSSLSRKHNELTSRTGDQSHTGGHSTGERDHRAWIVNLESFEQRYRSTHGFGIHFKFAHAVRLNLPPDQT